MSNLIKDIIDSIKGTEQDFTKMKLGRSIILLAIPTVLEMMMESLFAICDIFFVSRLGAEATATVGITESLMTIVYAIGMGLSMATTSIVSRRIGEHKFLKASISAFQAILLGVLISFPFFTVGAIAPKQILAFMGASNLVIETGYIYTGILIGSNVIILLLFINNAIFRSAGDAIVSMFVLFFANLLNIILDPCFIFGFGPFPELGITGAAVATSIGRGLAVILQFYLFIRKKRKIQITKNTVLVDLKIIARLIKLSVGGISQFLIATSSWVGLYMIMTKLGDEVVAGYTIAIRVIIFSILPAWGLSNAASILVGQNLGAKQPKRAEHSVWIISLVNMAFLSLVGICFYFAAPLIMQIFTNEKDILDVGVLCLQILCFGYLFYALGMVMSQAFNGAGDTYTPTLLNLICFWIVEIPLAYYLSSVALMNEKGVFISILIAESMLGIFSLLLFKRGKWKTKVV